MGADFIGAIVWLPNDQKPDWKAGQQAIQKLASMPMSDWPTDFVEFWADENEDTKKAADVLQRDLECVQEHWDDGGRESGMVCVMGINILLTGGMSYGEAPTDLMDCINRLGSADVLEACGLNP